MASQNNFAMLGGDFLLILTSTVVLLLSYLFWKHFTLYSRWNHLPGLSSWSSVPFIGHAYHLRKDYYGTLTSMKEKYGNVFRLDLGSIPTVFLCDYKDINEAFKLEAFSGRPHKLLEGYTYMRGVASSGVVTQPGVATSDGKEWQDNRKFMIRHLSDMGMGKNDSMEAIISQESMSFVSALRERCQKGQSLVSVGNLYAPLTSNVLWRLVTGKHTDQNDPFLKDLVERMSKMIRGLSPGNLLALLQVNYAWFIKICQRFGIENGADLTLPLKKMIREEIGLHNESDPHGNLIERYREEIKAAASPKNTFFGLRGEQHMFYGILDLFNAGTETSSTFMSWFINYMTAYPEIQEKAYEELTDLLGGHPPSLQEQNSTPYLNAVILEVMRHSNMVGTNGPHCTLQDVTFRGHFIPKGTQVMGFYTATHFDENHFPEPQLFRPERFINQDGTFQNSELVSFFGLGKRRCPGEALARAELYIFCSSLLLNFRISSPEDHEPTFKVRPGLIFQTQPFQARFEERV